MSIMTVLGKIDKDDLGIVSSHEHVFIDMSVFFSHPDEIGMKNIAYSPVTIDKLGILKRNPFAVLDNVQMLNEDIQINELMYFKSAGGKTLFDATNVGLGRDPELLAMVSVKTGLNIITGAGFYVDGAQSEETKNRSIEDLEEQIVKEITVGISHTNICAGVIGEIGISHIMTPFEEKSLHASCRAQKRTGAPISIHINPWSTQGIEAMKIVNQYDIDPRKIVICHIDVENREEYIFKLLNTGVYVEFDNFGKEMFTDKWDCKPGSGRFVSDWERVLLIKKILAEGYIDQVLFSCDVCLKSLLHAYGGWGYDHVLKHILPMLEEVGVTKTQMNQILINNPAHWLEF